MTAALTGLRVIEVGDFVSAPYCSKLLADLGADVIKVESPRGDSARRYGPFRNDEPHPERSGLFLYLNTNKKGITLNLRAAAGREALGRLLDNADVLVENVEPSHVTEMGLDWTSLRSQHSRLIVTSISVFGRSGPYCHFRGHGLQASAGSSVAYRTGDPKRSPLSKPLNEAEFLGGVHGAAGTLMARRYLKQTGVAQHVDISIQALLAGVTSGPMLASILSGVGNPPERSGNRVNSFFPWTVLPVADGHMEFITMQERHWREFIHLIGDPEWADDPRFANMQSRVQHAEEIEAHIVAAVGHRTRDELWGEFRQHNIPFQPVHRVNELAGSDQLQFRGYFQKISDGGDSTFSVPGAPYQMTDTPWELRTSAPRLGQHTNEVLRGLGFTNAQLVDLARSEVI
ncbi:MAG: CoA transferase [Fimbriimonadaceae bacterium]|nr:CoA transferase [Fimbriimonadaceae bacterium]